MLSFLFLLFGFPFIVLFIVGFMTAGLLKKPAQPPASSSSPPATSTTSTAGKSPSV